MKLKKLFILISTVFLFVSCSRLDNLTWDVSADTWLATHSYTRVQTLGLDFILAEPSSTIIVYGLGLILLLASFLTLRKKEKSTARTLWAVGLFVWGISTFAAGTSYQAFSYELKCAGRAISLWTTWWEIWYLMLFVVSMNVIAASVAFSSAKGILRKGILSYSILNTIVYLALVLTGAFIPNYFMTSFECMVLFVGPTFVFLLIINIRRYLREKRKIDFGLALGWLCMFLTVLAYFLFYLSGIAAQLWKNGIWFNANDVLHIALILWIAYYLFCINPYIEDV